jgi:predicted KAP-like P-loop ATPase
MKIKLPISEPNPDNPFDDNDVLNRISSAEILTQLISTIKEPFVLAIDSPWGTGKTFFVKRWMLYLRGEGYPCLYFNAWENDFTDDPLVSLIGELEANIEEIAPSKKHISIDGLKDAATSLVKIGVPVATKIATLGNIGKEEIDELIRGLSERPGKELIEQYKKDKENIGVFKEKLSSFVKTISEYSPDKQKPLVFFIDELDRCRPIYAINLLEKAKHFFNIDGIIFVLAIDKEQIGHSIRGLYGTGMDVDGYLRRFIDLDYHIPKPETIKYCEFLYAKYQITDFFTKSGMDIRNDVVRKYVTEVAATLFSTFNMSLRTQEQCFAQFNVAIRIQPFLEGAVLYEFLVMLIILNALDSNKLKEFSDKKISSQNLLDYIENKSTILSHNNELTLRMKSFINLAHSSKRDIDRIYNKLDEEAEKQRTGGSFTKEQQAELQIAYILSNCYSNYGHSFLNVLIDKMQIVDRFNLKITL